MPAASAIHDLNHEQVAQAIVDDTGNSHAILDRERRTLEEVNHCTYWEDAEPGKPTALNARYKVESRTWAICTGVAHSLNAPFYTPNVADYVAGGQAHKTPPPLPEEYPHPERIDPHPEPIARFLRDAAMLGESAASRLADPAHNPDPNYPSFLETAVKARKLAGKAHRALQAKEKPLESSRSKRTQAIQYDDEDTPLMLARGTLVDTSYFYVQPLFSADLACNEKGITEPWQIARVILKNLDLFNSLARLHMTSFPYAVPAYDHRDNVPNAGTFTRMHTMAQGRGRMFLGIEDSLVMSALLSSNGQCPMSKPTHPQAWSDEYFDRFYKQVADTYDLSPEEFSLTDKSTGRLHFILSTLIAEQTFLGQSRDLILEDRLS